MEALRNRKSPAEGFAQLAHASGARMEGRIDKKGIAGFQSRKKIGQ